MEIRDYTPSNVLFSAIVTAVLFAAPQYALSQGANLVLEEVVVSAQKREQSLGDVGIAVTAFSGNEMKSLGMYQPKDIAAHSPNVRINNTTANSIPNITIRGIGVNDYAANNNPAAGIYVDEVYLVSPAMLGFQLFDIERVEVLRGPQGTLYGRNTTGGAVNFISNKPSEEFESSISLDYGNYDFKAAEGSISGKLSPRLSGRISAKITDQSDGHQFNRDTARDVGAIDNRAVRGLLSFDAADNLNILLNLYSGRDKSDVYLVKLDSDPDPDVHRSGGGGITRQDIDSDGAAVTLNWDINETVTLTSITAYNKLKRLHREDRDASPALFLDGTFDNDIKQTSQELRLTLEPTDNLTAIVGLFYSKDSVDTTDEFLSTDLLPVFGFPGTSVIANAYEQDTKSAALFVHTEWQFNPDYRLTAALRYTSEEKDFTAITYMRDLAGQRIPLVFFPEPTDQSADFDDISGKLAIDYTGIDGTLLYASVSKGYKSGGFQGQLAFSPQVIRPFDEEIVYAFEVGSKSTLLSNLQLNTALFFTKYNDMQSFATRPTPIGPLASISNIGDAEILGAELELWWKPLQGLDIKLGLGYLDTEITKVSDLTAGDASGAIRVREGNRLANSPEFTSNGLVRYEFENFSDSMVPFVMLDFSYQDAHFFDQTARPEFGENGYTIVNASAGLTAVDERWSVSLWGRNITDKEYKTVASFSSIGTSFTYGVPATYGITAKFNW